MNPSLDNLANLVPETATAAAEQVIPVFEEELSVAKRVVETARVRVSRVTHEYQQMVDELLEHEKVEVERVPIGKPVDVMPSVRQEGDITIIPVVEEVLKVERHLVLKEEMHIRRIRQTERHQEMVTLRRQEAQVSRIPIETERSPEKGAEPNALEPGENR